MSYILRIVVPALPDDDALAWKAADAVCANEDDAAAKAPVLVKLHGVLTSVYPCLCSDDADIDDSPWSDGPLINNFGKESATLGLSTDDDDGSAVGFIIAAGRTLGASPEQVGTILARPGVQVKRGIDYLTALRYQAMLRRLGCRSSIETEPPRAA